MPDLTELLTLLRSDDPRARCEAVERSAVAVERLTHAVVTSLESAGDHQRYVADHVHRFGTLMVGPLEELLGRTRDADTSVLCALLLLRLHSRAGVGVLRDAIARGSDWAAPAARALAEAGVREAAASIIHRLRTVPVARGEEIVALLEALDRLEHAIPADVVPRLSHPDLPTAARRIVERARDATSATATPR